MTTYVYGIVISVIMIAAGLSGQFSGGGSGINIPLVAVGTIFLVIDIMMLLQARKGKQQAPQARTVQPTNAEPEQIEVNAEVLNSEQLQEAAAETVAEESAETAPRTLTENPAEASIGEVTEAPIENPESFSEEKATEPPIENQVELLAGNAVEASIANSGEPPAEEAAKVIAEGAN